MNTKTTMKGLAKQNGIWLEITDGPSHERDNTGWEHHAYTLRLHSGPRAMTMSWKQGMLCTEDPTVEKALNAIAVDYVDTGDSAYDFEDWARDLGYDTDSREAEAIYRACIAQTKDARALLGDLLHTLVYDTERL